MADNTQPVPLVRTSLQPYLGQHLKLSMEPHAGLLITRGWEKFVKGDASNGSKADHVAKVCRLRASGLYTLAYERWHALTLQSPERFSGWHGQIQGRMLMGLATGGALETGVTTSHTYGMPMIPGSSIKGLVRAHAEALRVPAAYLAVLFGEAEDLAAVAEEGRDPVLAGAGCLVWHDAWWNPETPIKAPFVEEVVTVHHQKYYAGEGDATDFDAPVPCAQIAVQGSFYFVIEGDAGWRDLALKILTSALEASGVGAKRATGYGVVREDFQGNRKDKDALKSARRDAASPENKIRDVLEDLRQNADLAARKFGKDKNKTLTELGGEPMKSTVRRLGREILAEHLERWAANKNDGNEKKAYKFFMAQSNE